MDSPKIDVCLSPKLLSNFDLKGTTVVVIDVLRATSTMAWILHNEAAGVIPVESLEQCLAYEAGDYILGAERGGQKPSGFEFGNSPFDYSSDKVKGKRVVLTTTNGTRAIHASMGAKHIILGSFINLNAVIKFLAEKKTDVILFCAGWKERVNMEDTLFAGAVVDRLKVDFQIASDAALVARQMYVNAEEHLFDVIKHASHYQRLAKLGIEEDIHFCLSPNQTDILPILDDEIIVPHAD